MLDEVSRGKDLAEKQLIILGAPLPQTLPLLSNREKQKATKKILITHRRHTHPTARLPLHPDKSSSIII
jgi:predicted NAD/FAD-dependent oxidoreductase